MIGEFQKQQDGTYTVSVKMSAQQVELLNAICNALGVNSYQIFQMFFALIKLFLRQPNFSHFCSPYCFPFGINSL